jgi:hypothetical protein
MYGVKKYGVGVGTRGRTGQGWLLGVVSGHVLTLWCVIHLLPHILCPVPFSLIWNDELAFKQPKHMKRVGGGGFGPKSQNQVVEARIWVGWWK